MANYKDRVRDTSTTSGVGDFTLSGTAPTDYQSFAAAFSISDRVYYTIEYPGTGEWEVGRGTLTGSTTLQRTEVSASSNGGLLVNFSSGTKTVFCTIPANQAGSPGSDMQMPWNNNGAWGSSPNLKYNVATGILRIEDTVANDGYYNEISAYQIFMDGVDGAGIEYQLGMSANLMLFLERGPNYGVTSLSRGFNFTSQYLRFFRKAGNDYLQIDFKMPPPAAGTTLVELNLPTTVPVFGDGMRMGASSQLYWMAMREKLAAARNYYVRSDGSDSNDGLANTSGGAWLTLQHAWETISGTLDLNGYIVIVNIGAGSFAGFYSRRYGACPNGSVVFLGAGYASTTLTPSPLANDTVIDTFGYHGSCSVYINDVTIDPVSNGATGAVYVEKSSRVLIGVHLTTSGVLTYGTVAVTGRTNYGFFTAIGLGEILIWGTLRITGNLDVLASAVGSGYVEFYTDSIVCIGTPDATTSWLYASDGGSIYWRVVAVTGASTGRQTDIELGRLSKVTNNLLGDLASYISPTGFIQDYVTSGAYTWDLGTKSAGTLTLSAASGPVQQYTNNGAHTLAPPTTTGNWQKFTLHVINGAAAGAVTVSGWSKVIGRFETTNAHRFVCDCEKINSDTVLTIRSITGDPLTVSSSAPTTPAVNDLWVDTT